jgi:four helix bundle protein
MKMNIALKETSETKYWLRLLKATDYLTDKEQESILSDCIELAKLLTSIVKTTNERVK